MAGYGSPSTTPAAFRPLTQVVLATALHRAGKWVCEPLADLSLEMPSATGQRVLAALRRLHFFDGFRTSHEINKTAVLEETDIRELQSLLPAFYGDTALWVYDMATDSAEQVSTGGLITDFAPRP